MLNYNNVIIVKLEMVEETGGLPSVPVTFLLVSVVLAGALLLTRSVNKSSDNPR